MLIKDNISIGLLQYMVKRISYNPSSRNSRKFRDNKVPRVPRPLRGQMDPTERMNFILTWCPGAKSNVVTFQGHRNGNFLGIILSRCLNVKSIYPGIVLTNNALRSQLVRVDKGIRHLVRHPQGFMDDQEKALPCLRTLPYCATGHNGNVSNSAN